MSIVLSVLADFAHSIYQILHSKMTLLLSLLFVFRLIFLTMLEKRNPAHEVSYREVLPLDILATLICSFVVIPTAAANKRRG
jgi:hypothetical protein